MPPIKSPYEAGAEFILELEAPNLRQEITKRLIRVRVLRLYSFTHGQSTKVAVLAQSEGCDLPSTAFLKLYDRRFLRDRMMKDAKEPWSPEREAEAEKIWMKLSEHAKLSHRLAQDDDIWIGDSDDSEDEDCYDQELKTLKQWDRRAFESWRIELLMYSLETKRWFKNECQAYRQLHTLQGRCIPKFYHYRA
jgi:hypothetical protein